MGMGTLHLGDKISGISNAEEVNAWIQEAVSLGITLFDLAVRHTVIDLYTSPLILQLTSLPLSQHLRMSTQ